MGRGDIIVFSLADFIFLSGTFALRNIFRMRLGHESGPEPSSEPIRRSCRHSSKSEPDAIGMSSERQCELGTLPLAGPPVEGLIAYWQVSLLRLRRSVHIAEGGGRGPRGVSEAQGCITGLPFLPSIITMYTCTAETPEGGLQ
jgi:hypothetical protein